MSTTRRSFVAGAAALPAAPHDGKLDMLVTSAHSNMRVLVMALSGYAEGPHDWSQCSQDEDWAADLASFALGVYRDIEAVRVYLEGEEVAS